MTTTNGLVLIGAIGSSQPIYNLQRDLPAKAQYSRGSIEGDKSMYVVYSTPAFAPDQQGASHIIESVSPVETWIGFDARSTQGFDKRGIVLFEHDQYRGNGKLFVQSAANLENTFGAGTGEGVSSFIVYKGVWALYTGTNFKGTQIMLNGSIEFGPGTKMSFVGAAANDLAKSVQLLRDT